MELEVGQQYHTEGGALVEIVEITDIGHYTIKVLEGSPKWNSYDMCRWLIDRRGRFCRTCYDYPHYLDLQLPAQNQLVGRRQGIATIYGTI